MKWLNSVIFKHILKFLLFIFWPLHIILNVSLFYFREKRELFLCIKETKGIFSISKMNLTLVLKFTRYQQPSFMFGSQVEYRGLFLEFRGHLHNWRFQNSNGCKW